MVGLALSGGGTKGSYHVGVYLALVRSKIKLDGIAGTSIGAFTAAAIVSNNADELYTFWETADLRKILASDNNDSVVKSAIKNMGIKLDFLKEEANRIIDENVIRQSKMDFGLVTVRARDFQPLYLFKDDIPLGKLIDYVTASSFLPIFKKEEIDNDNYLDGGFKDSLPYKMLLKKGYTKVYASDVTRLGFPKKFKDDRVIKIIPSRKTGFMLTTNNDKMVDNMKMGYYDTLKVLKKLDGFVYTFSDKRIWIYDMLVKKVSCEELDKLYKKHRVKNNKELIIKIIEYYFKKEKKDYNKIYSPIIELNKLKKKYNDDLLNKLTFI